MVSEPAPGKLPEKVMLPAVGGEATPDRTKP